MPSDIPRDRAGLIAWIEQQLAVCRAATPGPLERFNFIGHPGGLRLIRTRNSAPLVPSKGMHRKIAECALSEDARLFVEAANHYAAILARLLEVVEQLDKNERGGKIAGPGAETPDP